jgi:hypothetical protein
MARELLLPFLPYAIVSYAMTGLIVAAIGEILRARWWVKLLVTTAAWETAVLGILLWHLRPY